MRLHLLLILLLLFLLCSFDIQNQTIDYLLNIESKEHTPFHIKSNVKELMLELETRYQKKIEIVIVENKIGPVGQVRVEKEKLIIEIVENAQDKNELLLHELFHLKLFLMGVPYKIGWDIPKNENWQKNIEYLSWCDDMIWDKIQHYYFYPIINKQFNENPYKFFKKELDYYLKRHELPNLHEATKELSLAFYYLQTFVETNNNKYLKKYESFLEKNYNSLGIEEGKYLVDLLKKNDFNSKDSFVLLFVKCFNYINASTPINYQIIIDAEFENSSIVIFRFN
ncbi:MAG: hypothetical protein WC879_18235 [Melioribacteraceae bacterium]